MTQVDMLNEHLNVIYIIEKIDFSKIKSKAKEITNVASSGNILKFNRIFSNTEEVSSEEMISVARKKFGSEYKESIKHIDSKVKKAPQRIKDYLALGRACLLKINKDSKDPEIQSKIQENLQKLDDVLKRMQSKGMVDKGITMMLLAFIVSFFLGALLHLSVILLWSGILFIATAIFVYITRAIINLFIEKKKEGAKVVS